MALDILNIPVISTDKMKEIDRLMINKYGIQLIQMMENAGRNLAYIAKCCLNHKLTGKRIAIAAGKGNNGGGSLVAARFLSNWGAEIILMIENSLFKGIPALQFEILKNLPVEIKEGEIAINHLKESQIDLVIDGLIGYGLSGNPRGFVAPLIETINRKDIEVLSLDVPSGLDATTGKPNAPCIKADFTMTLALPKSGLVKGKASKYVGRLFLADIGIPFVLYKELGLNIDPIFQSCEILDLQALSGINKNSGRTLSLRNEPHSVEIDNSNTSKCLFLE